MPFDPSAGVESGVPIVSMLVPPPSNLYVRASKRPDGVVQLRTGIRRFRRDDGTEVTLVGAMHIGTVAYFDTQSVEYSSLLLHRWAAVAVRTLISCSFGVV